MDLLGYTQEFEDEVKLKINKLFAIRGSLIVLSRRDMDPQEAKLFDEKLK